MMLLWIDVAVSGTTGFKDMNNIKCFFIIISLLMAGFLPAIAEEETPVNFVTAPKWEDFCESGYENAKNTDRDDVFNVFTFVKSERVKRNYWAERRKSFESYLKTCDVLESDAKSACYDELRKSEEEKNDLYNIKRKQLLQENNIDIYR